MKVLTAAEMREVDRRTIECGIPEAVLIENAAQRVVEFLEARFRPLASHHIVVFCGKGNNGADGQAIANQLRTRFHPRMLQIFRTGSDEPIPPSAHDATLIIDAVLGTGMQSAARGRALDFIREINTGFPRAKVVAVDIPSGMVSDLGQSPGEFARADATVTFTAPKIAHAMPPNCDHIGELTVSGIGSPPELYKNVRLHLTEPSDFRHLFRPRKPDSNKGGYGHVLVVAGAQGKTGAAEMAGMAAMAIGAGLVTVACSAAQLHTLELMTAPLPQNYGELQRAFEKKTILAIGPGLGSEPEVAAMTRQAAAELEAPMVIDADGLNALAGHKWRAPGHARVVTPHPGEMGRLGEISIADVQSDRLRVAEQYSADHGCVTVLKGHRTVIAFPDGQTWINPVDTPALSKGGTGDILTGLIAGLMAQHQEDVQACVIGAVYLHGLAGRMVASHRTEFCLFATDLLDYLPEAIRACSNLPD